MGSTHTNQLTHREALELLPWHVNASLGESLSRLVESHVEECPACQEESAVLAGAIIALSADKPDYSSADARFQSLMGRIRAEERKQTVDREQTPSPFARLREWLRPEPQWAAAFTIGLVVGAAVLFGTLQFTEVTPVDSEYRVLSGADAGLQLTVRFTHAPSAETLERLGSQITPVHAWQAQGDVVYVIDIADDASVRDVAIVRSMLLADEAVDSVSLSAP